MKRAILLLAGLAVALAAWLLVALMSPALLAGSAMLLGFGVGYALIVRLSDRDRAGAVSPHTATLVVAGVLVVLVVAGVARVLSWPDVGRLYVLFSAAGLSMWVEYYDRHCDLLRRLPAREIAEDL